MTQEQELKGRILDLAECCWHQGRYTFSGFLNAGEQAVFFGMEREVSFVPWTLYGGGEDCERRMLRFGSEDLLGYTEEFPIRCLVAEPAVEKFAEDLNHRDFLGALMHLGIERDVLGDIVVKNSTGYIFCETAMAEFLCENLTRVRHTSVVCRLERGCPEAAKPEFLVEEHVVSSNRADAVAAKVFHLSRGECLELFRAQRVFLNGRVFENNSGSLKPGDIVSVRGFGKFVFDGVKGDTKKGKIRAAVRRYV